MQPLLFALKPLLVTQMADVDGGGVIRDTRPNDCKKMHHFKSKKLQKMLFVQSISFSI